MAAVSGPFSASAKQFASGEASDNSPQIKERIEFFFGDSNWRRDKWLRGEAKKSPDGFVGIDVLLRFNTLRALTDSVEAVAAVAEKSDVVVLSDDRKSVRRKNKAEEGRVDTNPLKLYAKGFPQLAETTWESVRDAFSVEGAKVTYVSMRRRRNGDFKGSAIIEFASKADCEKVLAAKPKYKGEELAEIKTLAEWLKENAEEKKAQAEKLRQEQEAEIAALYPKDSIIRATGWPANGNWVDLQKALMEHGRVIFIGIIGSTAFARMYNTKDAKKAIEACGSSVDIMGTPVALAMADADEQSAYWEQMFQENKEKSIMKKIEALKAEHQKKERQKSNGGRFNKKRGRDRGGNGHGRGGHGRGRGRVGGSKSNKTPLGKRVKLSSTSHTYPATLP